MRLIFLVFGLSFLSVCGRVETQGITQEEISMYGPRWIDIDGWGMLEFGMPKNEVLQTMGEPFMTEQGFITGQNKTEVLIFKVRV